MTATPLYAAILALMCIVLSFRVIGVRRSEKISLGAGDSQELLVRIRSHANFIEYVPFVLLLMLMAEGQGGSVWLIHLIGLALLIGRGLHAYGMARMPEFFFGRYWGMILTFSALLAGAILNLWLVAF